MSSICKNENLSGHVGGNHRGEEKEQIVEGFHTTSREIAKKLQRSITPKKTTCPQRRPPEQKQRQMTSDCPQLVFEKCSGQRSSRGERLQGARRWGPQQTKAGVEALTKRQGAGMGYWGKDQGPREEGSGSGSDRRAACTTLQGRDINSCD